MPHLSKLIVILLISSLYVFNLQGQEDITTNEPDMTYVIDVQWSHDGAKLAAVGIRYPISHGYIRIFDMVTGETQYTLNPPSSGFTSVAWSPDDKYLTIAGYDQVIWVIDTELGEHVASMWGH